MANSIIPFNVARTFSDVWSSRKEYEIGDFCVYKNILYKATQAGAGHEPPNNTYWVITNVGAELKRLDSYVNWIDYELSQV